MPLFLRPLHVRKMIKSKKLYCKYQPLIGRNNSTFAHEALMRSETGMNPFELFQEAREKGFLYELDTEGILNAIGEYPEAYLRKYPLFINILPSTIVDGRFKNFITYLFMKYPKIRKQIIFEINETPLEKAIWEQPLFHTRMNVLRTIGFRIAFDDLPITKDSFEKMETFSPDFVKLDHKRSKNLSYSLEKQELISLVLEFAENKIKLVLEGIETKEDLLTAKRLGVPLFQGFYLAKPKRLLG